MKVYVAVMEPYHDGSTVLGAYSSIEKAQQAVPGDWITDGWYCLNRTGVVAQHRDEKKNEGQVMLLEFLLDDEEESPSRAPGSLGLPNIEPTRFREKERNP